jgi:dTDP-4-amino-4,6-dideoxygalactose transaminase
MEGFPQVCFVIGPTASFIPCGGHIVTNYLVKLLNDINIKAALWTNDFENIEASPYNIPITNKIDKQKTLVIYTEGLVGNPLNADNVGRWILYDPRKINPHLIPNWKHSDSIMSYGSYEPIPSHFSLPIADFNENIFQFSNGPRSKKLYYAHKALQCHWDLNQLQPILNNLKEQGFQFLPAKLSNQQYSEILSQTSILISFDLNTYISNAAVLSGCLSLLYLSKDNPQSFKEITDNRGTYGSIGLYPYSDDLLNSSYDLNLRKKEASQYRSFISTANNLNHFINYFNLNYNLQKPKHKIPFNKPYFHQSCIENIQKSAINGIQSGDGPFSQSIYNELSKKYNFHNSLLVPSCTHALEIMALLINLKPGDEIIIPSYTFVSTANAFEKYGATVIPVDSLPDNPNIDPSLIQEKINSKTKAICIVHYAGVPCDMELILQICQQNKIILLEDAAQAFNSFYKGKPLGSFGHLSAFSFHETKNINCGEGGLLVINDQQYIERAHIIREKGTNRTSFLNNKIDKYQWIDIGSSYLLSDINAAYLLPQVQNIDSIQNHRSNCWKRYHSLLKNNVHFNIPDISIDSNHHIFYLTFVLQANLIKTKYFLSLHNILSTTHYVPLHSSQYFKNKYPSFDNSNLINCLKFESKLLRLPLYNSLTLDEIDYISFLVKYINNINIFISKHKDCEPSDIQEIALLKKSFWDYDLQSQIDFINNSSKDNDIHVKCYYNNLLIGYTQLKIHPNYIVVDSLIILKYHRNMKLGTYLLDYISKHLVSNQPIFLISNQNTIPFYQKNKFQIVNDATFLDKKIIENQFILAKNLDINHNLKLIDIKSLKYF